MILPLNEIYKKSEDLAKEYGHNFVTVDHITSTLLNMDSIKDVFKDVLNLDVDGLKVEFDNLLKKSYTIPLVENDENSSMPITPFVDQIFTELSKKAIIEQLDEKNDSISALFMLFECMSFPNTILEAILLENGKSRSDAGILIARHIQDIADMDVRESTSVKYDEDNSPTRNTSNKSEKDSLDNFITNLTDKARNGELDPLIGREIELHDLEQILSRKKKKSGVLVGEAGVGKTEIVNGLAQNIVSGNIPDNMKDVEIWSLNISAMLSGTKYRGDFEGRVNKLLKVLKDRPNVILFIDEIHTIMNAGSGSSGSMDMSNMLKPALAEGNIRVIGTTTLDEYRKHIEKDSALSRRFMKIDVNEPSIEETREIIAGLVPSYEKHHGVKFTDEAIETILELSAKYMQTRHFPDKAIDIMDAAGARNRVRPTPADVITHDDIIVEVSRITNLPKDVIGCTESVRMRELSDSLRSRVFGQDEAINELVSNVMIARAGLREQNSIQGAFLFVGSSGTGKTEIAKGLASLMGVELVRFDMSEFSAEHTVSKLIGSPPGYVGYSEGNGQLLDKVEQYPNCVLLLDEIEKAHPNVLLPLLQVMDEGHLTGSQGKTVYFNNVTIIMTTNLGSRNSNAVGIGLTSSIDDGITKAVNAFLPPEFRNRLDSIVRFNDLNDSVIMSIVDKFINDVNNSMKSRGIEIVVDQPAKEWLAKHGTEKGMGARPMKRCITNNIKKVLAPELLYGSLMNGGTAKFTVKDDKIILIK